MANYLLTAPSVSGRTTQNGVNAMLVAAPNETIARLMAAGEVSGDGDALWNTGASAVAIAAASGWAGWVMRVRIVDENGAEKADVSVDAPTTYIATTVTLGDGGSGYEVGDELHIVSSDPEDDDVKAIATVATVAEGIVEDTITVTNGGSFTPDLADKTAVATVNISGTGTGLTVDVVTSGSDPYTIDSVSVVAGGTGYEVGDTFGIAGADGAVLTIATVDGALGEVLTVTLSDGGNYVNDPTDNGLATETDGNGTGATINITAVQGGGAGDIDAIGLQMAESLNALSIISNASFNPTTNVLTIAGAADNLGDHTVYVDMTPPNCEGTCNSVLGSIVHEGGAGDALTVALPADNYDIPAIFARMRGV